MGFRGEENFNSKNQNLLKIPHKPPLISLHFAVNTFLHPNWRSCFFSRPINVPPGHHQTDQMLTKSYNFADETQSNKVSSARDQMQLPLTKDDSSEGRNVVTAMDSSPQPESPPKLVPDKDNQTNDSEVILRRTQSFENDDKWVFFFHNWIELLNSFFWLSISLFFDVNSINATE